jgi:hypothetical protein
LAKCNNSDDSRDLTNGDRGSLITAVIEKATAAATAVYEDKATGKAACAAAVAAAVSLSAGRSSQIVRRERGNLINRGACSLSEDSPAL